MNHEFCLRLTWTLFHFLWQGLSIAALAMLVGWSLRGAAANVRYSVHVAALLLMAICLPLTFILVDVPSPLPAPLNTPIALASDSPESAPAVGGSDDVAARLPVAAEPTYARPAPEINVPTVAGQAPPEASPATGITPLSPSADAPLLVRSAPYTAGLYAIGLVIMLLKFAAGLWGGQRLRSDSVPVTDNQLLGVLRRQADRLKLRVAPALATCRRVGVPIVIGILKPVILLPAGFATSLTQQQLEALLTHELAHIRRCDLLVNIFQRLIEATLFFHPAVWYISRRVSFERELACDDSVLRSGWRKRDYAVALVRMAELCAAPPVAVGALAASGHQPSQFKRRIQRLMNVTDESRLRLTRGGMFGLLMAVALLIVVPSLAHTSAQAPTPTPDSPAPADVNSPASALLEPEAPTGSGPNSQPPASPRPATRKPKTWRKPPFLLPDHWILCDVGFDKDNKELVTASRQSFVTIRRWDVVGRKLLSEVKLAGDKHARKVKHHTLTLSRDCRRVAASTDQYVGIWDTATGKLLKQLPIPKVGEKGWERDQAAYLACTPDLSVIAAAMGTMYERTTMVYDAYVVVWDVASGKPPLVIKHKHGNYFTSIAISPDGTQVTAANGGTAVSWDARDGRQLFDVPRGKWKSPAPDVIRNHMVQGVQYSPDGNQLAVGSTFGVKLIDTRTGDLLRRIEAPYRYGSGRYFFSPDGNLLARTGTHVQKKGRAVPIWSTRTGELLHTLQTESNTVAFSNNSEQVVVAFSDRQAALAVFQLAGQDVPSKQSATQPPAFGKNKIAENSHYNGTKPAEFIAQWKPAWGEPRRGFQYGVGLTTAESKFRNGTRVLMAAFFRNVSNKTMQIDVRPDFYWNLPKLVNVDGKVIPLEKSALLGTNPRYRATLKPGEALGPLYLNVGLGENPRPGKQHWHPYYKTPLTGRYAATHHVSVRVAAPGASRDEKSDDWLSAELTSGSLTFEIVSGDD